MNWLQRLAARFQRQDLAEEIQEHLDEKIEELVAAGMPREEATFAARRAFGNVAITMEQGRAVWISPLLETWWTDSRYAARQLRKNPGITSVAVLSSALGIGAATALFSIVYAVLLSPFPYINADRLVHLHVFSKGGFLYDLPLSDRQLAEFRTLPSIDRAIAMDMQTLTETDTRGNQPVVAGYVSPDTFEVLGVAPLAGRTFDRAALDGTDSGRDVVLGFAYWMSRHGGRTDIVGETIQLARQPYRVVGVMPRRFTWGECDVFLPLEPSTNPDRPATVFARLKNGVSFEAAERELQEAVASLAAHRPGSLPPDFELRLIGLGDIAAAPLSGVVSIAGAAVVLLLLVGCANVSILLLVKGTTKARELAIRAAMGASRGRLIRQLLTESLLISIAGAVLGSVLAYRAVHAIPAWLPHGVFPSESIVEVNVPVLIFAALTAVVTGLGFGLAPALALSRPESGAISHAAPSMDIVPGTSRSHYALIVVQVALTLVLLAGTGATLRGLDALFRTPLNYAPEHLTSLRVDLSDGAYGTWEARVQYLLRASAAASAVSGVQSAALSIGDLPPVPPFHSSRVFFDGQRSVSADAVLIAKVGAGYFDTLGIPMLSGRSWSDGETAQAAHVAVVNRALAERYWPGESALWKRLFLPDLKAATSWALEAPAHNGWVEVVGVAADTPNTGLKDPVAPAVYVPFSLVVDDGFRLVVRASESPMAVARGVAEAIQRLDPDQAVGAVQTGPDVLASQGWAREQFTASLFGVFALLAVFLSAAGLYSVVSYVVATRAQEFGVRMALGAAPGEMMRTVVAVAMSPTVVGISAGLGLCRVFDNVLLPWTRETAVDPYVLVPVVAVLLLSATLAALGPAQRAASLNPMTVLRGD